MKYLGRLFLLFTLVSGCLAQETTSENNLDLSPKEVILKSFELLEKEKSISAVVLTTNDATEGIVKEVFNFVSPDSYQVVMFYNDKKEFETITVGKEAYNFYQGKWEKSGEVEFEELSNFVQKLIEDVSLVKSAKYIGMEKINNSETSVYQYEYDVTGAKEKIENRFGKKLPDYPDEIITKIWINKNGLPLKKESIRKVEGLDDKIETIVRVTTYEFGKNIKIEIPIT